MKKPYVIIALVAVLALVVAGVFLVKGLGSDETTDPTGDIKQEIVLVSKPNSEVDYFEYTYDGETVTIKRDGDKFYAEENAEFPLNQNAVILMLVYSSNVVSTQQVDVTEVEDLDTTFGFNESPLEIKVHMLDGTIITETFGAYNGYTDSYFFKTSAKEGVYLMDDTMLNYFAYHLNELAALPTDWSEFDLYTTLQFAVKTSDNAYEFIAYGQGNPNYYDSTANNYAWFLGFPYETPRACSTSPVQGVLKNILDLVPDVGVDYNVTEEDLAEYGLDNPKSSIYVYYVLSEEATTDVTTDSTEDTKIYTSYEYTLNMGYPVGSYTYVQLTVNEVNPESGESKPHNVDGVVYGILTETLDKILSFDASTALTMDMCKMDIATVDKVEIFYDDGTSITTVIDHKNVTEQQELLFSTLNAIVADDRTTINVTDTEPDITIKFYRNTDNFSEMTMTLTEYGTQYYRLNFAGINELLINKREIESLKNVINGLNQ